MKRKHRDSHQSGSGLGHATPWPEGLGEASPQLHGMQRSLERLILETQHGYAHETLLLPRHQVTELASILMDFAEDVHAGIGIWEAYERYNVELFGVPLPLTSSESAIALKGPHPDRVRHLLWVLFPAFTPGLALSHSHQDLVRLLDAVHAFLTAAFRSVQADSKVKAFLRTPNTYAWDIKRKLVWLGTQSYLFRSMFAGYMAQNSQNPHDIGHTDDFLCQECTRWSGLGVIDLLAGLLELAEQNRRDLRSWYERHASFYQVRSATDEVVELQNFVCDRPYRVRMNMPGHPFRKDQMLFGSLVPWRGEWYWSGEQRSWGQAEKMDFADLRDSMKRKTPKIVCRMWPEYEAQVRKLAQEVHARMIVHYGKDLIVHQDGLAMAADWQKEIRVDWDSRPRELVETVAQRHGVKAGKPDMSIPRHILEHHGGIGVFINPDEGKEMMLSFDALVSGLKRQGQALTADELNAIRSFVQQDSISPEFVKRVIQEHGEVSVREAFALPGDVPGYWLDYLLRSHKGLYYRKRYPSMAVI